MEKMELVNVNDNSFDPTPKLKSSPIPILFVSFNEKDDNCFHCGEKYVELSFCRKKYCKKCFSHYITYIDDINTYLDVYFTMNIKCSEHETSNLKKSQNIQEYCRNFLDILYFKQIPTEYLINYDFDFYYGSFNNKLYVNVIESVNYCKLCKKSLYQGTDTIVMHSFKLCSDCYLISSEWIESTLTKKPIPITYLPCRYFLNELKSNYQCGCPSIIKTYGNLWIKKLDILHEISYGLKNIHETNFIHRDFHSGNILRAEIYQTFEDWRNNNVNRVQFHLAEIKRVELMKSKKLGPKFTEKHSKAIYTNYASKDQELDIDIDIESNSSSEFINSSRNELNIETFYSNKKIYLYYGFYTYIRSVYRK
ncbi:kinase-like domain-containing protein [Rhizophagus irregularis DAOM 181602=DAOM 197198]|nr:kinase-like domain-containing protein [Rhizophagus irregularis DAOM 181602=DAOM 197198]